MEDVNIERAHRSPAVRDPNKETPRPIIVAFLHWDDANTVLFQVLKLQKATLFKQKMEQLYICLLISYTAQR